MMPKRNIDWGGKESLGGENEPEKQPTPAPAPGGPEQDGVKDGPQEGHSAKPTAEPGIFGEQEAADEGAVDAADQEGVFGTGGNDGVFEPVDPGSPDEGTFPEPVPPPPPPSFPGGPDPIIDEKVDLRDLDADRLYVFMYGKPQTGKSVILSGLLRFLETDDAITLTIENQAMDMPSRVKLRELKSSIREKRFVSGTSQLKQGSQVWEMKCTITPNVKSNRLPELKLAFLELAGEDLKQIMVGSNAFQGELDPRIRHYLTSWDNEENMCFFMVAPADEAEENEEALTDMFMYMTQNKMHRAPSIVMLSKWDKLGASASRPGELQRILKDEMPSTWQQIKSMERDVATMRYSIGKSDDGVSFEYDPTDSKSLARRLYRIGTGYERDPWDAAPESGGGGWFSGIFKK